MRLLRNKIFQSGIAAAALSFYIIQVSFVCLFIFIINPLTFTVSVHIKEILLLSAGCILIVATVLYQSELLLKRNEILVFSSKKNILKIFKDLSIILILSLAFFALIANPHQSILAKTILLSNVFVAAAFPMVSLLKTFINISLIQFSPRKIYGHALHLSSSTSAMINIDQNSGAQYSDDTLWNRPNNFFSSDIRVRRKSVEDYFSSHQVIVNLCRRERKVLLIAGISILNIDIIRETHGSAGRISLLEQVLLLLNEYSRGYEKWGYDHEHAIFYNFLMISSDHYVNNLQKRIEPVFKHITFAINGVIVEPDPKFFYIICHSESLPDNTAAEEINIFFKKQIAALQGITNG